MRAQGQQPKYSLAEDVFVDWRTDVFEGDPPVVFEVTGMDDFSTGPGQITLIGGAPGSGKSAFTMQYVFEAVRDNPNAKAVICNVEMSHQSLLDRQLARLAMVDARAIRRRQLDEEQRERALDAMEVMDNFIDRICFVEPPYSIENLVATGCEFDANIFVADYIQRLEPYTDGKVGKEASDETMNYLRRVAEHDAAVIVVSAVGRSKDSRGRSSYDSDSLSMASYRESSELEFGADDAYILGDYKPKKKGEAVMPDHVVLRHLKSRHDERRDRHFLFEKGWQRFNPHDPYQWQPAGNGEADGSGLEGFVR